MNFTAILLLVAVMLTHFNFQVSVNSGLGQILVADVPELAV
jgi:hypothetical protein